MLPVYRDKYIVAQDMGASFVGPIINTKGNSGFSVQAIYIGAPTGTLSVQGSNDGLNWSDLPGAAAIAGPDSFLFNLGEVWFRYARLSYVRTGGAGTLSANVYTKEVM